MLMRVGVGMTVVIAVAVAMRPSTASATPPGCGPLQLEDALAGATVGAQSGGTLDAAGFRAAGSDPPGTIVWEIDPPLREGCVEVTISGVTTAGVGEHDLLELFTGPSGAFSDGAMDHFLLYKIAGDVFPEYEGRLKVEMGEENSAIEVGTWSANLAWAPADTHTLAVRLDGAGIAELYRDDELLDVVDYSEIGDLSFVSLRIPNDGSYQVSPPLLDVVFSDVRVFVVPGPEGGDTGDGDGTTGASADDTAGGGTAGPGSTGDGMSGSDGPDGGDGGSTTAAGDDATGATGSIGPGLPAPGARGDDDSGCACTATPRRGPWVVLFGGLLLAAIRRRVRRLQT